MMLVYNGGRHLEDAIAALCRDLTNPAEAPPIYFFDDASPEPVAGRIEAAMQGRGLRYQVIRWRRNRGETGSMNLAFAWLATQGIEWALLLHQDDALIGGYVRALQALLPALPADVGLVCCYSQSEDPDRVHAPLTEPLDPDAVTRHYPAGRDGVTKMSAEYFWTPPGAVFRVPAHNRIGGWHPGLRWAHDNDFITRLMLNGHAMRAFSAFPGIYKRQHRGNATNALARTQVPGECWSYLMVMNTRIFNVRKGPAADLIRRTWPLTKHGIRQSIKQHDLRFLIGCLGSAWVQLRTALSIATSGRIAPPASVQALLAHRFEPLSPLTLDEAGGDVILRHP